MNIVLVTEIRCVAVRSNRQGKHTISEKTWKHELSTVADSIHSAILNDQTLVANKKSLQRRDDLTKVLFIVLVVHLPLSVQNVVQGNQTLGLVHGTTAHTTKLLHVSANAEKKTQVHTEGTDVGTGLAADPEDAQMTIVVELDKLALVDGSDTQLTFDSGDQRRTLEQSTGKRLQGLGKGSLTAWDLVVEADDSNVFFTSSLLRLDKTSGAVNADDETTGDLGIEGAGVTSLLASTTCPRSVFRFQLKPIAHPDICLP